MCEQLGFRTSLPVLPTNWPRLSKLIRTDKYRRQTHHFLVFQNKIEKPTQMSSVQIDGAGDGTNLKTDPLGVNLRTKPNFTFFQPYQLRTECGPKWASMLTLPQKIIPFTILLILFNSYSIHFTGCQCLPVGFHYDDPAKTSSCRWRRWFTNALFNSFRSSTESIICSVVSARGFSSEHRCPAAKFQARAAS